MKEGGPCLIPPLRPIPRESLGWAPGEGCLPPTFPHHHPRHLRLMQETLTRGGAGKDERFQDSGLLLNTPYLEPPLNPHQPTQDEGHREPGRARLVSPCCRRG